MSRKTLKDKVKTAFSRGSLIAAATALGFGAIQGTPARAANIFWENNGDWSPVNNTELVGSDGLNNFSQGVLNPINLPLNIPVSANRSILMDGNGFGTVQVIAMGEDYEVTGSPTITVDRTLATSRALNKIIQQRNLTIGVSTMTVTNNNGYGLEFNGTTTLSGLATFSVATASSVVQNSGLILSGVVDDGAGTFGLIKTGAGTLELLGVNTFGGAGQTIMISGGILAANSDAALGNTANTVTLNANALTAVGFRAIETFTTARTFVLGQANNSIEVALGETLTLTSPFSRAGGGNAAILGKSIGGVLELAADNTGWTGELRITGGIVRLMHNNAAGSGKIIASVNSDWRGNGLQLAGGITVNNPIDLQNAGTNNVLYGGIDFSGNLSSYSGVNTYAGLISFPNDASIGARAGSTLNITGGINNIVSGTNARLLAFNAEGIINISSPITATGGLTNLNAVFKVGAGELNITNRQIFTLASNQWFNIREGTVRLSGSSEVVSTGTNAATFPSGAMGQSVITLKGTDTIASLGLKIGTIVRGTDVPGRYTTINSVDTTNNTFTVSANLTAAVSTNLTFLNGGILEASVLIDRGGRLVLDHTINGTHTEGNNFTAIGRLGYSGTASRPVNFRGGELIVLGSKNDRDTIFENVNPSFSRGSTIITLQKDFSSRVVMVFGASPGSLAPAQNASTPPSGASVLFRGQGIGLSNDPGNSNFVFANGSSTNGQTGGVNTQNKSIFPWALVDNTNTGLGNSFATVDNTGGGGNASSNDRSIRALNPGEYSSSVSANNNVLLATARNNQVTATVTPNSLTFGAQTPNPISPLFLVDLTMNNGARLSLSSGGILVRNGITTVISGGVLNQPNSNSPLNIWTVGTAMLTIDSEISGGNGVSNGNISMVKAGAGTLVLNPPRSVIAGLTAIGTNSLSGQFVLNEGTVRLGAGLKNAIQPNNFAALFGGTLDLNGGSQFFHTVFSDQQYAANNTVVMNSAGNLPANTAHILINNDNTERHWGGSIQGNIKFTRSGQSTTNLYSEHTYTGSTAINGGNVRLTDEARLINTSSIEINYGGLLIENGSGTMFLPDRINDAASFNLRGANLELRGRQQVMSSETIGVVTLAASNSTILAAGSGIAGSYTQLNITRLNRTVGGGTVNFNLTTNGGLTGTSNRIVILNLNGTDISNPANPNAGLTNGILDGWAIVNQSDFATAIPGLGVAAMGTAGYLAYSNTAWATNTIAVASSTHNININAAVSGGVTVSGNKTINSLRLGNFSNTIDITAGSVLTLSSGGLLFYINNDSRTLTIGQSGVQGSITSGTSELFVYNRAGSTNATRVQRINSRIIDGTSPIALNKSGDGNLFFAGTNTYTGGTYVNQGTLTIETTSIIPAATDPFKGLVISGATVNLLGPGLIAPTNYVTISGTGTLAYNGDNTQYGLVIDNDGSSSNPTIRTFSALNANGNGSKGVLTIGAGGIIATSGNVGTIGTIVGRMSFGATGGTINVAAIDVNGVTDIDPLRAAIGIESIVNTSGAINKIGTGVLQLNAQSIFTGTFNISAGGLRNATGNAGSRFSQLNIAAGARYDLANAGTTWGSLSGSGDIFNSINGTPTLNVGFDNTDSTFSGRLMRFNDASYVQLTKVGTGTLIMNSAQTADGSWSDIRVEGGRLVYSGAGKAFPAVESSTSSTFRVEEGSVLELSNAAMAIDNRLGLNVAGTLAPRGGTVILGGNSTSTVTERITTLDPEFGSGRIELRPDASQRMLLNIGTINGGDNHSTMLITGLSGNLIGNGIANVSIGNANFLGNQSPQEAGSNGTTNMSVRGDILADANVNGVGTGFLVRDGVQVNVPTLTAINPATGVSVDHTFTVSSTQGILIGARVSNIDSVAFSGNWTVKAINGNMVTVSNDTVADSYIVANTNINIIFANYWRALAPNELNLTPRGATGNGTGGWVHGQNAGVTSAQTTLLVDTTVNTLTFSGTASLNSSLGAAFGSYGPGGRALTLQLSGATAFLVKDGTTNIGIGSISSNGGTTIYGHVLAGATANFNAGSGLGLNSTGGFVKAGDGVLNLNAQTYFTPSIISFNQGTVNLNSGLANTIPVLMTAGGVSASILRVEGINAVVDLRNQPQAINELRSSNEKSNQAGTVTNSGAAMVNFTTYGNSAFSGSITGNLNLVREGNSTTILTGSSSYMGLTLVRGGNLELRDGGAITGTGGIQVNNGRLFLNNNGLNAVESPTRINPANAITLSGGEFRLEGAGSSDIVMNVNSITATSGRNTINVQPIRFQNSTIRMTIGNLVSPIASNSKGMVIFNGWIGENTLGGNALTGAANVFINQIDGTAFTASNLVNNLIGGWAVADGSTFATYDNLFGVVAMGSTYGGYTSPAYTGNDISATTVATGNYNDSAAARTISTGAKVANSWRLGKGDGEQVITFASGATVTLGTGIITNVNQIVRLTPTDATNTITTANGADLHVFINQHTAVIGPKLTGSMALISSGGATLIVRPTFASNDYTGGTFVNAGTLNVDGTGVASRVALASGATTDASTTVTVGSTAGLSAGMVITGANIPVGTTIASITNATTLVLSAPATGAATGQNFTASNFSGSTTSGSTTVNVASTVGLLPGMQVTGANIPLGARIASVNNVALTAGATTNASTTVTVASTTGLSAGMVITGPNIPGGTTIASITDATTLVLSKPATAAATAQNFAASSTSFVLDVAASGTDTGQVFSAGFVAIPGDLTIQNANLTMGTGVEKAGQVAATSNVTIKGHGRFILPDYNNMVAGINVINRINTFTFITDGAQGSNPEVSLGNPNDVAAFSVLALSGTNAITATNQVVSRVPTFSTGDAGRTRLVFNNANPLITVNAGEGPVGLTMNVPITQATNTAVATGGFTNMTSLTKMGLGTLTMVHADSDFSANFVLAKGTLMVGSNSTLSMTAEGTPFISKGPIGTGTLVIENGTTILSDNTARTLHNPVTVNGDFTFGGVLAGADLTLAGNVNLGDAPRTISVAGLGVTATINGTLTSTAPAAGVGFTKTGAGTLSFGAATTVNLNGAGFTIAGGIVKVGEEYQIPRASLLTIAAGAGLDTFGKNQTFDVIAGQGFITNSFTDATDFTVGNSTNFTFEGSFGDNKKVNTSTNSLLNVKKVGSGIMTLTGVSVNSGLTTITAGTLRIAGTGNLGSGNILINSDATLEYARTGVYEVTSIITSSSSGNLNISGAGAVAKFTANSTPQLNAINVFAGTLQFGDGGTTGGITGATSFSLGDSANATVRTSLRINRSNDFDFDSAIVGNASSSIVQAGTGKTTLTAKNTEFVGTVSVLAGELVAGSSSVLNMVQSISISENAKFTAAEGALGYYGDSSNPHIIITGGEFRLFQDTDTSNNVIGDLSMAGGTISSGTPSEGITSLFVIGGVDVTENATISASNVSFNYEGLSTAFTPLYIDGGKTLTFSGTLIADSNTPSTFAFDKQGTGTILLSGDNGGLNADIQVSAGDLVVQHNKALGNYVQDRVTNILAGARIISDADELTTDQLTSIEGNIELAASQTLNSIIQRATISTGPNLGNFAANRLKLNQGAQIEIKLYDTTLAAGVGYDKFTIGTTLDLSGVTSSNPVVIKLISMSAVDTPGVAHNVSFPTTSLLNIGSYSTSGLNLGSNSNITDLFAVDSSQFTFTGQSSPVADALWSIDFNVMDGSITLTAVPEPSTYAFGIGALALAAAATRRRRKKK